MIWKKYWPKFTVAFMVAIMAVMCIGSAVFADSSTGQGVQNPYFFNPSDPGFKYLNKQAQEAAKVVGYGIQSLTPKYYMTTWTYGGDVTWYPNVGAYKAAALTPGQKDVKIGPYMWSVKEALEKDSYKLPIGD